MFSSIPNLNRHYAQDHPDEKKGANAPYQKIFQTIAMGRGREMEAPGQGQEMRETSNHREMRGWGMRIRAR
jgi:hypothetical protein